MIRLKRVYEPPSPDDGQRVLVERLWPRGLSKEKAAVDEWLKEVAPSPELRRWFNHDPDRWDEFRRRYLSELEGNPAIAPDVTQATAQAVTRAIARIQELVEAGPVTFVYAARDEQHNSARILKEFLESR